MKMNLKIAFFTALTSVAALTGCDDKTSVEWYTAHHDEMLNKYGECLAKHNFLPPDCQNARSALHMEMDKDDVRVAYNKIVNDLVNKEKKPIADLN